jgi:gliding motility-associated lipoprotein GldD
VDFQLDDCPLSFSYPDYMQVDIRENYFEDEPVHPCWFDMEAPQLGAKLHFSYYPIGSGKALDGLVTDAFRMADRITQRANYMDEIRVANAHGVSGVIMEFSGAAASPMHFYMTDSTTHFLKASVYFRSKVVPDSLAPVLDFLQEDIAVMLNSLTFK